MSSGLREYQRCSECGSLRPKTELHAIVDGMLRCADRGYCQRAREELSIENRLPPAPMVNAARKNGV